MSKPIHNNNDKKDKLPSPRSLKKVRPVKETKNAKKKPGPENRRLPAKKTTKAAVKATPGLEQINAVIRELKADKQYAITKQESTTNGLLRLFICLFSIGAITSLAITFTGTIADIFFFSAGSWKLKANPVLPIFLSATIVLLSFLVSIRKKSKLISDYAAFSETVAVIMAKDLNDPQTIAKLIDVLLSKNYPAARKDKSSGHADGSKQRPDILDINLSSKEDIKFMYGGKAKGTG